MALAALLSAACSGPYSQPNVSAKQSQPPVAVQIETVAESAIPEVITANGELFAEEMTTVSAKVPGRVARLHIDLGSLVQAGQVLVELEKDDYEFRVRQYEAAVEQIRARLGIQGAPNDNVVPEQTAIVREAAAALYEANFIFETTTRLQKDGVVSRIDFEKAQVRAQGARARVQSSIEEVMQLRAQLSERRAQLELGRQQLSDTVVRAPFAGGITRRQASLGEYLATNSAVATLVRLHPLRIRLDVPERQAARVRAGQRIELTLEGSVLTRAGQVVRLSPAIEAQNRSLLVEGEVPNQDGVLRPGSFAQGTITVNAAARGISIPSSALLTFAGIERVLVVKDAALEERIVRTARRLAGERIEIVSGLAPGDKLVRNANDKMTPGQRVQTR